MCANNSWVPHLARYQINAQQRVQYRAPALVIVTREETCVLFPFGNIRCGGWERWPKLLSQVNPLMFLQVALSDFPPVLENQLFQEGRPLSDHFQGQRLLGQLWKCLLSETPPSHPRRTKGKEVKKKNSFSGWKKKSASYPRPQSSLMYPEQEDQRAPNNSFLSHATRFACLIRSILIHFIQSKTTKSKDKHTRYTLLPRPSATLSHLCASSMSYVPLYLEVHYHPSTDKAAEFSLGWGRFFSIF